MTPHVGGIHLAHLRIVERMAKTAGDQEFAEECKKWLDQGSASMENKLWAGKYYLAYYEPDSGRSLNSCLAISWTETGCAFITACQGLSAGSSQDHARHDPRHLHGDCALWSGEFCQSRWHSCRVGEIHGRGLGTRLRIVWLLSP